MEIATQGNFRPEWTGEVIGKLHLFNISKRQFAEMIGINYTAVSNTLTGYLNRADIREKILAGIEELENCRLAEERGKPTGT